MGDILKKNKDLISVLSFALGFILLLVLGQVFHVLPFSLPFFSQGISQKGVEATPSPVSSSDGSQVESSSATSSPPAPESASPSPQSSEGAAVAPAAEASQSANGGASVPAVGSNASAPNEKQVKGNTEIFKEMYEVTLITEVKDLKQIEPWVNTLNQGASLEGVYHGLTKSNEYLALEKKTPPASVAAVKAFTEEMDELQQELPERFHSKESVPTQVSIYTYKRLLGEEALKVFEVKYQDKDKAKVAMWYARLATRLARRQIDFGLELRNKADLNFHQTWALDALERKSEEQLKWEILNRLHRILNEANKIQADANRKEP